MLSASEVERRPPRLGSDRSQVIKCSGKEWIWVGKMWAKTRMNGRNDISMQLKGCTVLKMSRASSTFQHGSGGEARNW